MKQYSFWELAKIVGRADTEEKVKVAREFVAKQTYLTDDERWQLNVALDEALTPDDDDDWPDWDVGNARDYDYSPSAPWGAPGMKVSDFITGVKYW